MKFEEFLKDLRKKLGMTQQEVADRNYLSFKTISNYENQKRQCTFNLGMALLNSLGASVVIENEEIKLIEKGEDIMNTRYIEQNLDFINFNAKEVLIKCKEKIEEDKKSSSELFNKAVEKLNSEGFEYYFSRNYDYSKSLDEYYDNDTVIATIKKDDKQINLQICGYNDYDMFIFESFIEALYAKDSQIADYIEKVLLFYAVKQGRGADIFTALKSLDKKVIETELPLLEAYSDIVITTLKEHDTHFFFKLNYGYNIDELTISMILGIYDCYSTPYIYYTYEIEDETVYSEDSFDGHDINEALMYAADYFEDYDSYAATIKEQ